MSNQESSPLKEFEAVTEKWDKIQARSLWQEKYAESVKQEMLKLVEQLRQRLKSENKVAKLLYGENPLTYLDIDGYVNTAEWGSWGSEGFKQPFSEFIEQTYFVYFPETAKEIYRALTSPVLMEPVMYNPIAPRFRYVSKEQMGTLVEKLKV